MTDVKLDQSIRAIQIIGDIYQVSGILFSFASECIQKLTKGEALSETEEQRLLVFKNALTSSNIEEKVDKRKLKRPKKDPQAPKRPISAFLIYYVQNRDRIRNENQQVTNPELGSVAGKEWKEMDSKAREKYTDEAKKMHDNYLCQLEAYKKTKAVNSMALPVKPIIPIEETQKENITNDNNALKSVSTVLSQSYEEISSPIHKDHRSSDERKKEKERIKMKKYKKEKRKEKKHKEKTIVKDHDSSD